MVPEDAIRVVQVTPFAVSERSNATSSVVTLDTVPSISGGRVSSFLRVGPDVDKYDGCQDGQKESSQLRMCRPDRTRKAQHPRSRSDYARD